MRLSGILKNLYEDNAQAAEKAHALGLTSDGFGRWKDESGTVVAMTKGGELVKVNTQSAPSGVEHSVASAAPTPRAAAPRKPRPRRPSQAAKSTSPTSPTVQTPHPSGLTAHPVPQTKFIKDYDARYRSKEWYGNAPTITPEQITALGNAKHIDEVWHAISHIIDADPSVKLRAPSPKLDDFEMMMQGVSGMYEPFEREVHLAGRVVHRVEELGKQGIGKVMQQIRSGQFAGTLGPGLPIPAEIILMDAVHVMIHESVHAKDPYLAYSKKIEEPSPRGWAFRQFWVEALTETKARQITSALVGNDPNWMAYQKALGAYHNECATMQLLEELSPGIGDALWRLDNTDQRGALVSKIIEKKTKAVFAEWCKTNDSRLDVKTKAKLAKSWQKFELAMGTTWDALVYSGFANSLIKDLEDNEDDLTPEIVIRALGIGADGKKEDDRSIAKLRMPKIPPQDALEVP